MAQSRNDLRESCAESTAPGDKRACRHASSAIGSYLDSSVKTDQATTILLTLTSALRGIVTVYHPEIEYDLP
jgi:hypothetical protein